MANPNAPFGFKPIIRAGGSPFSVTAYGKPATDPQAIFMFDAVGKFSGAAALNENPAYNLPVIGSGYKGGTLAPGVATAYWLGASLNYGAASTLTNHFVTDELDVVYLAQCKTGTVVTTAAHAGKTANLSVTTPGSTLTKLSGMAVDGASIAPGAVGAGALDLFIRSVTMTSPYTEGDSAVFEVIFNKHFYAPATAGV